MRHVLDKHCKCTGHNFREFGGIGGYAIFSKAPVAADGGRSVRYTVLTATIDQRASILQCLECPIESTLGLVKIE